MSFSKVTVKVPDVNQQFKQGNYDYSSSAVKTANVNMLKSIRSKYLTSINAYGSDLSIPNGVIVSFIASESGGTPVQQSNPSGAKQYDVWGVMALSPTAFYDAVSKWKNHSKTQDIPESIKAKINQKIPSLLKGASYDKVSSQIRTAISNDMDFNILGGCLVLRWLFERFSVTGTTLFNKALVSYNAGLYQPFLRSGKSTSPDLTPKDTSTLVADKTIPIESRSYLLKVLGKDGFMDLIYGQKLVPA